jgi:hypothetical protein
MPGSSLVRSTLTVVMNVLFVLALAVTTRIVVEFFGALAMTTLGDAVVTATEFFVLPLELGGPRTPYGGYFDLDAALTVVVLMLLEWMLSIVRSRA